jgi:lipoic acid synthetase
MRKVVSVELMDRNLPWLVKRFYSTENFFRMKKILNHYNLNTVCQEALCPNMSECFSQKRVTFLILGDRCSRSCAFCFVKQGRSLDFDPDEETKKIVEVVRNLALKHVVITSVTRDDLADKGAVHFARVVKAVKTINPGITVETLIPDLSGEVRLIGLVCDSGVDILNHNVETVPRLYFQLRPQADYQRSLRVLKIARDFGVLTKSGMMLGLGEEESEVIEVFRDLRNSGVDILTVGQYLKPGKDNLEVREFITPEKFEFYRRLAYNIGFRYVCAGPFVRSSYQAEEIVENVRHRINS